MKNRGQKNRFNIKEKAIWLDWYECALCRKNQWDCLHHIICPSVRCYVPGKHNESLLNSCPLHNYPCHVGNESHLYKPETIADLLQNTASALQIMGYRLNDRDREFMRVYSQFYP